MTTAETKPILFVVFKILHYKNITQYQSRIRICIRLHLQLFVYGKIFCGSRATTVIYTVSQKNCANLFVKYEPI